MNNIPKPPPPRHVHCHKDVEPDSLITLKVYRGGVNHEKQDSLINATRLVIMAIGFTIGFSLGILIRHNLSTICFYTPSV